MGNDVTESCRDIKELNPLCQVLLQLALDEIKKNGVTPLLVETYRSQARQNYLYEQGRTREGNKVTWTRNSIHTLRNAVDLIPQRDGKAIWNSNDKDTRKIIDIMEQYGFEAGANWSTSKDSPHFQLKGVLTDGEVYSESNNNKFIAKVVQKALEIKPDGCWGKGTTDAINKWKKSLGWKPNGTLGTTALKKLLS